LAISLSTITPTDSHVGPAARCRYKDEAYVETALLLSLVILRWKSCES
jgi:hypothetical protein